MIRAALVILALLSLAEPASAQDSTVEARQHFARGVAHYEAGRHTQALEEFEAAFRLRSHPAVLVNIANCDLRLGRYPEAVVAFERYLAESTNLPAAQRTETEHALEEARGHVGEILLTVNPPGAAVRVDGREVGRTPFSRPLIVAAGHHHIEAAAPGRERMSRELDVEARLTTQWNVTLPTSGTAPPVVRTPPAPIVPPSAPVVSPGPTGVLAVRTEEPGVDVRVDGTLVGVTPWEGPVHAGQAAVEVGGWSGPVELSEGQHARLSIQAGATPPDTRLSKVLVGAAVTGGLLLGTTITGLLAISAQSDFDDIARKINDQHPTGRELDRLRQQGRDAADRLSAWSTTSDVFLVCTMLAAGGTLIYYFAAAPHADDPTAHFEIGFGPGSARVAGRF